MAKGFEKPNHTQTPNSFFASLPNIKSASELKIILAIIRRTFGWHKESDKISLSQLEEDTGLTRESVSQGIQSALEHGYIKRKRDGLGHIYSLRVVGKSDWSEKPTSPKSRLELVGKADREVVGNIDPQKKGIKEKKEMSDYALLFDRHYKRVNGDVQKKQAQGKAIREILERHSPVKALACYDSQLAETWRRGHVDWLTVRARIGEFQTNGNGHESTHDEAWHEKQAKLAEKLGRVYERPSTT